MKVETRYESSTNINEGVKDFQISASPEMFMLLSSGLYKDKIKAIVRELGTNAFDAMVDAGNDLDRVYVHVPTREEPYFSIRDFGTGLSEDDVYKLYTTYGASNKRESNDFNGCLGVGSKSPFAYSSTFTVESFKDGVHYSFIAFINDGSPKVTKASEQPTDEPNGLQITVPVAEKDMYSFSNAIESVYRWFPYVPDMNIHMDVDRRKYDAIKTKGYCIDTIGNVRVLMGNVLYSFESDDEVKDIFPWWENVGYNKNRISNFGIIIKADIGDVNFAASREKLSNDSKTIDFIKDKVVEILNESFCDIMDENKNSSFSDIYYSFHNSALEDYTRAYYMHRLAEKIKAYETENFSVVAETNKITFRSKNMIHFISEKTKRDDSYSQSFSMLSVIVKYDKMKFYRKVSDELRTRHSSYNKKATIGFIASNLLTDKDNEFLKNVFGRAFYCLEDYIKENSIGERSCVPRPKKKKGEGITFYTCVGDGSLMFSQTSISKRDDTDYILVEKKGGKFIFNNEDVSFDLYFSRIVRKQFKILTGRDIEIFGVRKKDMKDAFEVYDFLMTPNQYLDKVLGAKKKTIAIKPSEEQCVSYFLGIGVASKLKSYFRTHEQYLLDEKISDFRDLVLRYEEFKVNNIKTAVSILSGGEYNIKVVQPRKPKPLKWFMDNVDFESSQFKSIVRYESFSCLFDYLYTKKVAPSFAYELGCVKNKKALSEIEEILKLKQEEN